MADSPVATIADLHREMARVAELLEVLNYRLALQDARVTEIVRAIGRTPGAAIPYKSAQPKPPPLVPFRYMSAAQQADHPFYKAAPEPRPPPSAAQQIVEPVLYKAISPVHKTAPMLHPAPRR
jgi:hypothetical protein